MGVDFAGCWGSKGKTPDLKGEEGRRRWLHCFVEDDEMHLDFSWAALKERSTGSEKPRAEGERGTTRGREPMGNS